MCTNEHPIRICNDGINNKWVKASELKHEDKLTFCRPLFKKNKIISEDLVRVIGWFICEGSYWNKIVNFALSSKEINNQNELINSLKKITDNKIIIRDLGDRGVCSINVNSCELGEFLIKHCGSGALNKKIPIELIAGYEKLLYETLIKGDGCNVVIRKKHEKDSYATISRTLAYQVQLLAHAVGYRAGISVGKIKTQRFFSREKISYCKPAYTVRINKFNPSPNTKRHKRISLRIHKYNISARIIKIEKEYKETKVYNLEVDVDNSYTANGRVVHNCAFLSSGRSVFESDIIRQQRKNILEIGDVRKEEGKENFTVYLKDGWVIYREPEKDGLYVCGADISEGIEGGDYSFATIFDRKTGEEVAMWRGLTAPDRFGEILNKKGREYNNALMVPEVNNHGLTTITILKQLLYPSMYFRQAKLETLGATMTDRMGWRTTVITKPRLIDDFVQMARDKEIVIHSKITLDEMSVFVYDDAGNMVPQSGFHDDTIFGTGICLQGFKVLFSGKLDQLDYKQHLPKSFSY
jgi:hypothetical protein